jgi:hypothetical protein
MEQKETQPDPWHKSLTRRYEPGGMRLRWFLTAVIGFAVLGVIMHIAIWFVLKGFARDARQVDVPRSVLTDHVPRLNGPPLQATQSHDATPQVDLEQMKQHEDQVFADLGWKVDPDRHRAQPPDDLLQAVAARMQASRTATTQNGGAP